MRKVLKNGAAPEKIDDFDRFASVLVEIMDELSEYMISVILAPVGLQNLSDNVVDWIKERVNRVRIALSNYWREARGPFGIPGGGQL
jgi:hypothetical protein